MQTKILIIGAGPYGVAIGLELQRLNIPFIVAGQPFSLWFNHTLDNMAIRSDWHSSEIFTHDRRFDVLQYIRQQYPDDWQQLTSDRLPVGIFRNYLRHVLTQLPFEIHNELVENVEQTEQGFSSTLQSGATIESEAVIVATGIERHRYLPQSLAQLDSSKVLHGWHANSYSSWGGKKLLVVGAGQSAAEAVVLLKKRNRVTWVARQAPIYYSEPLDLPVPIFNFVLKVSPWFYYLPRTLKKIFGKKYVIPTITPDLRPELESPEVTALVEDVDHMGLEMRAGKIYSSSLNAYFDAVVAATGYRYNIDNLTFLDSGLRSQVQHREGTPDIDNQFRTSVPNLFMVGGMAEPSYGPAQRFMMGALHASSRMGRVAQTL